MHHLAVSINKRVLTTNIVSRPQLAIGIACFKYLHIFNHYCILPTYLTYTLFVSPLEFGYSTLQHVSLNDPFEQEYYSRRNKEIFTIFTDLQGFSYHSILTRSIYMRLVILSSLLVNFSGET